MTFSTEEEATKFYKTLKVAEEAQAEKEKAANTKETKTPTTPTSTAKKGKQTTTPGDTPNPKRRKGDQGGALSEGRLGG